MIRILDESDKQELNQRINRMSEGLIQSDQNLSSLTKKIYLTDEDFTKGVLLSDGTVLNSTHYVSKYVDIETMAQTQLKVLCTIYSSISFVYYMEDKKTVVESINENNASDYGISPNYEAQEITTVIPKNAKYFRFCVHSSAYISGGVYYIIQNFGEIPDAINELREKDIEINKKIEENKIEFLKFGKELTVSSGYYNEQKGTVENKSYRKTEILKIQFIPDDLSIIPYSVMTWHYGSEFKQTLWTNISKVPIFDEIAFIFKAADIPEEKVIIQSNSILKEEIVNKIENTIGPSLKGKTITIIGDSISTNGSFGEDCNIAEITITNDDIGKALSAYVSPYDVLNTNGTLTNLSIGGHLFIKEEIGTEVSFIPTSEDVGKSIGVPLTYNQNNVKVWWEYVRDKFECKINPVCWSGASISSHEENDVNSYGIPLYKTAHAWHEAQIRKCGIRTPGTMERISPDLILIYRGTNDFSHAPYAILTNDYGNSLDYQYPVTDKIEDGVYGYKEALVITISKLRSQYPKAKIFLCTLNIFKRINYNHFPTNNGINTLPQYNHAIREVAELMGCDTIDFDRCGITFENCYSEGYITDSETTPTHPSNKGHEVMGKKAIADLNAKYNELI